MIRRNGSKDFLLITQNEHAALAGRIAAAWGNDGFCEPAPRDEVVTAIERHDAGWSIHDDKPTLNREHIPAAFYEMPVCLFVRVWVASVSAAAAAGPMAGLIVSWHFTSLARLAPLDGESEAVHNSLSGFLAAQHCRQLDYCCALRLSHSMAASPPSPLTEQDHKVLYNLWLLRTCDWLSLMMCDDELPFQSPPDAPPGVGPLVVTRKDRRTLQLKPWPLKVPRLSVEIEGRKVPAGRYRSEADLLRVYAGAASRKISLNLVPSVAARRVSRSPA
jgi:hypothetical protein